jgi:hypothetical protein
VEVGGAGVAVSVEVGDGVGVALGVDVGVCVGVGVFVGVQVALGDGVGVAAGLGVTVCVGDLEGVGAGDNASATCAATLSGSPIACGGGWLPQAVSKPMRKRESTQ